MLRSFWNQGLGVSPLWALVIVQPPYWSHHGVCVLSVHCERTKAGTRVVDERFIQHKPVKYFVTNQIKFQHN